MSIEKTTKKPTNNLTQPLLNIYATLTLLGIQVGNIWLVINAVRYALIGNITFMPGSNNLLLASKIILTTIVVAFSVQSSWQIFLFAANPKQDYLINFTKLTLITLNLVLLANLLS